MPNYKRAFAPGGTFFFTLALLERNRHLLTEHIDYNPVKHGHVNQVVDWPYSSFHRYVRLGVLPQNWAAGEDVIQMNME